MIALFVKDTHTYRRTPCPLLSFMHGEKNLKSVAINFSLPFLGAVSGVSGHKYKRIYPPMEEQQRMKGDSNGQDS
jgi:hypothetical protein